MPEARFKCWKVKKKMLESNHQSVQSYHRTRELLSLSCFLVVMTLRVRQRRVFLAIQTNVRQQILFKRKLRWWKIIGMSLSQ